MIDYLKHKEGEFRGVNGLKIYYQCWIPNSSKEVIQLVHGGFEHSGRYQNVIDELSPLNYAISISPFSISFII